MPISRGIDRFQRKHGVLGFPIAVIYKFTDDQGAYLAALVAYYGFLSLFPLLLLLTTVLGFVLHHSPTLQAQVLNSALGQFPLIGNDLPKGRLQGSTWALAIGLAGIVYGGLGVAQASQNAMNVVWAVPRNKRANPIKSRLRSLLLLGVVGLGVLGTSALSGFTSTGRAFGVDFGPVAHVAVTLASIAVNAAVFLLAFRVATVRSIPTRDIIVGALGAAVAWQALQIVGARYVSFQLHTASATYGTFGLVLGLLAWIYLEAVAIVFCAELNVVLVRRLWPRALMTPFTDNVQLTAADENAYALYAEAQRTKGFEKIDVTFRGHPARRSRRERLRDRNRPG